MQKYHAREGGMRALLNDMRADGAWRPMNNRHRGKVLLYDI